MWRVQERMAGDISSWRTTWLLAPYVFFFLRYLRLCAGDASTWLYYRPKKSPKQSLFSSAKEPEMGQARKVENVQKIITHWRQVPLKKLWPNPHHANKSSMYSLDFHHHQVVTEAPPSLKQGSIREGEIESQDFHSCWTITKHSPCDVSKNQGGVSGGLRGAGTLLPSQQ